jgi:hypothetical protein
MHAQNKCSKALKTLQTCDFIAQNNFQYFSHKILVYPFIFYIWIILLLSPYWINNFVKFIAKACFNISNNLMVTCLSYQCTFNKLMTRANTSWTPFNIQKSNLTMAEQHLLKLGRYIFVSIYQPIWVTHLLSFDIPDMDSKVQESKSTWWW